MPRPRSKRNQWMPVGVYLVRGRYILRRDGSELTLATADATQQQVLTAYVEATRTPAPEFTVGGLIDEYTRSERYRKLARWTQIDAEKAYKMIRNRPTKSGKAFGEFPAKSVTIVTIRLYMDKRGIESETRADRELSYLSMAYGWGLERGMVAINPCLGIRRFRPAGRDRYVTHEEFTERYLLAGELGLPHLQACMWFAYLCRLRESEILRLLESHVLQSGLLAKRGKGSKTQIVEWSDMLAEALALARSVPRRIATAHLIVSPHTGLPLTEEAFSTAWQRLRAEAIERGQDVSWTFHDLKAKGVSDARGDKHDASGHKSYRMTQLYDRLPGKVAATR